MKKLLNYFLILTLVPLFVLNGCKKDDDDDTTTVEKTSFVDLKNYLINNDMDIPDIVADWITTAAAVNTAGIANYYIMDIRGADDYNNGHIEGAVNSSLGTIVEDAASATKPILVVCYTGQTASHAVLALRLSGFADAKVLKWGMSSWNPAFSASWETNVGNTAAVNPAGWTGPDPIDLSDNATFDYPDWESTETDMEALIAERVDLITSGFKGVANTDVLTSYGSYFVNNYWALEDVEHYGHITGAYRILPLTLENDEIANLDPTAKVVTYCWTGQTSSMITAYLTFLGYDAYSLKFGANGMIYDNLESHKFSTDTEVNEFDYVTK